MQSKPIAALRGIEKQKSEVLVYRQKSQKRRYSLQYVKKSINYDLRYTTEFAAILLGIAKHCKT